MKNGIPNEPGKLKEFIFVPGNHDCCFDDVDEVANREKLIGDTLGYNGTVPPSVVNISCKLQKHFEDFVAEYSSQPETHNSLISVRNYIVNSFPINIYCFNTAWMSMKNEEKSDQPGKMYMPMNMLNNELFLRESKLNIAVLHHPDLWRNPTNAREFQRLIERTSDLAFIGHSHKEEQNLVDNLKHKRTIYVNGGAFKDKEKPGICQFKTISFDTESNKIKILSYDWKSTNFACVDDIDSKINHKNTTKEYPINQQTQQWLENLDIPLYHSGKDKLYLSDIFVYPPVISLSDLKNKESELALPLDSEKILNPRGEQNKILILGERKSGKTALLKTLFKRYYEAEFIPVFIDGRKIKSSSFENFKKTVNNAFLNQYSEDLIKKFQILTNDRKLILIDDFDQCKLNSSNSKALFSSISKWSASTTFAG